MFLKFKVVKTCDALPQAELVAMVNVEVLLVDMLVVLLVLLTFDAVQLLEMMAVTGNFVDVKEFDVLPLDQCPNRWVETILVGR
jgi:hypothetical protein